MKLNNIISVIALGSVLFASCGDDFLTVENPTAQPIEEYFTTADHLQEALVAAYAPLHWTDWSNGQYNPLPIMSDIMADQIWVGGESKTDNQFWHLMMNFEALPTNCMTSIWTCGYSGVKRCNDLIQYTGWTKAAGNITAEEETLMLEQARLLRVYYYSWLWKFWGNIVYYEKNLEDPYLGTQYQADEVYSKMIADLEGAIALDVLPLRQPDAKAGYLTKAFAYMLYAELVMYQKDEARYGTALAYMKEIIDDAAEYDLVDDYGTIFKPEGEWSKESIFEITYRADAQVRSYDNVLGAGGTILPQLIGPYNMTEGADDHKAGWGFAPVRQETYDMFTVGDARRDATCYDATVNAYETRYEDTGYFLEKYQGLQSEYNTGDGAPDMRFGNNFRIYRFAETLLNAAELALTSDPTNAKIWLNKVHNRAGLTDTVDATLANIKQERRLEFVGEGKRYWDLVRWGDAPTVLVPDTYGYRTATWSESKKYLPIPQSEIDAALGTLTQNNY